MNKIVATALVAVAAIAATPAGAQTINGTVNITGTVGGRCSIVQPGGGAEVQNFTGAIDLKRLDSADGTLRGSLGTSTAATPADGLNVATRVVCTSANPTVGISATRLNTGGATDPGVGYSNDVNYTAQVRVNTASGGTKAVTYSTLAGGAAASSQLGERIAAGGTNNVEVSVFGLTAEGGAASLLAEGTYTSTVTVFVNPTI